MVKEATVPKFLQKKKVAKIEIKEPPKESTEPEKKVQVVKKTKVTSIEKAPVEYEDAIKQIESSNRIYKKIDKKEEIRKEREKKKNQRVSYRSNLDALGFDAEAYFYLQSDLNLED